MAACHLFFTKIITLRCQCATYNWGFEGSSPTRAWLSLRIDNWTFFTQSSMTLEIASMLFTVQHFLACQLTLMPFKPNQVFEFTAFSITNMNPTTFFLFTYCLAMKLLFGMPSLITLYFSLSRSTSAELLNRYFTI